MRTHCSQSLTGIQIRVGISGNRESCLSFSKVCKGLYRGIEDYCFSTLGFSGEGRILPSTPQYFSSGLYLTPILFSKFSACT